MTSQELRAKFLEFFKEKGHAIIPPASLVPEHDPSVLFTTAGMHPLVSYLLGEPHPLGKRLANYQKCIRTTDVDEVGDSWHLTFFEMLGSWSLGDYFKKEAIEWSWEFLTEEKRLGVDKNRIYISVFAGDKDALRDEESAKIWQSLGVPKERIFYYGKEDNWWGPAGSTGPCGPDSEMFYDTGKPSCGKDCEPKCSCGKYAEIWNNVFMEYNKTEDGRYEPLKQKNVDTGMGLERTIAILSGKDNVYETDIFEPIIKKIAEISGKTYIEEQGETRAIRIIADHLRAATFILGDERGIEPSNVERGYVLRRLIRRAVRYGRLLGIKEVFTFKITETVVDLMQDVYPELNKNREFILEQLVKEEEKFSKTLEKGLKQVEKLSKADISGRDAFILFSTYGFPLEMTQELAREKGIKVDAEDFWQEFKKHQEISRVGAEVKFKGGLADHAEQTTKLHTATHLLLAALRQVLGGNIFQKGSNITAERLRFDFSYPQKLTADKIKKIEDLVNREIKKDLEVKMEEMSYGDAKKKGIMGVFEEKYGERVKVYIIDDPSAGSGQVFSKEICGGPHVKSTGELGKFKIIKEEAVGSGVRRIKAILL